ncbi:MAG: YabP/YqfC family sporulation protein [Oscillospiraceae bacterium]|nr:YabP/YqfC family sporulation protein [Oscillospiraceae bacterium]
MKRPDLIQPYSMTLTPAGLHIEGHQGIEEYSAESIAVRTKTKLLCITGRRLTLGAMTKSEVVITGVVQNIQISDRGRHR